MPRTNWLHNFLGAKMFGLGIFFSRCTWNPPYSILLVEIRRSERQRKPTTIWEQNTAPPAVRRSKSVKNALKTVRKSPLQPWYRAKL
jgi:hypothetical protein